VKNLRELISRASDINVVPAERHDAFGELVLRFQDMAFACAYAVLGDAYLAEDVAQEAFVCAWQKLFQLREPEAFAGWFKRIVLTQCNRLTRGKRLQLVPLDVVDASPARERGPQSTAEEQELLNKVLTAIKALPEAERLVTTLFYIDGYTQIDIGEFLELPVSTVNKRLYTARRRLREEVVEVDVFKDSLKRQRPSRDLSFADRVQANLRPLSDRDWPPISTMAAARESEDTPGNDLWLRNRRDFDDAAYERRQYVIEDGSTKQVLGYGSIEQSVYLPKYRMFIVTDPSRLKQGVGDQLIERLTNDLNAAGAVTVTCREYASQTELIDFLQRHGFQESTRLLDLRLSIADLDVDRFSPVATAVEQKGIVISTFAAERVSDPNCVEKLHELSATLLPDDPAWGPLAPPSYNAREALLWLERPWVLAEAYFIAKDGERYIGISDVNLFEAVPGGLRAGFTGVRRKYRRQGIATMLKLKTIAYARQHGYRIIQSLNRPAQTAALALNDKLGFKTQFSYVTLEKCLKTVIAVDPSVYDAYAGHYRDDKHPELELVVRKEGERLSLECVGQKVELYPESETRFFVKWFYGEANFFPDEQGRVDRLMFEIPAHKARRARLLEAKRIQ
jgi:RNA polymerase sigma factor (sigma-70 family)